MVIPFFICLKSTMHTQLPQEHIMAKILVIIGHKVLLDRDLAQLFGVETRVLKQAVRRNIDRFPEDFMLILSEEEVSSMVSQFVIPPKSYL